jgi:mannitol operon repressor
MANPIPMYKKRSLRKTDLDVKELLPFLESLTKESDRGAALVSAALLDDLLERSIRSLLIDHPLVDQLLERGPLGSAYSRGLAAFALGILSESEYQECERVRSVRNVFAHEVTCTFQTPKVTGICSDFKFILNPSTKGTDPRNQFLTSAIGLLVKLMKRPSDVSNRRLKYVEPQ